MSEKKKKEPKYYIEKTWKMDCWLALHQRLCWLIFAILAIGGGALFMLCVSDSIAYYGVFVLAVILMLGYQWTSQAPIRALNGWFIKRKQGKAAPCDVLSFLDALEKKLPAMKKKEMAFSLTEGRAVMLALTGKPREGIDLLENFNLCWDEAQRQRIAEDILKIKEETGYTPEEKEENACEQ